MNVQAEGPPDVDAMDQSPLPSNEWSSPEGRGDAESSVVPNAY